MVIDIQALEAEEEARKNSSGHRRLVGCPSPRKSADRYKESFEISGDAFEHRGVRVKFEVPLRAVSLYPGALSNVHEPRGAAKVAHGRRWVEPPHFGSGSEDASPPFEGSPGGGCARPQAPSSCSEASRPTWPRSPSPPSSPVRHADAAFDLARPRAPASDAPRDAWPRSPATSSPPHRRPDARPTRQDEGMSEPSFGSGVAEDAFSLERRRGQAEAGESRWRHRKQEEASGHSRPQERVQPVRLTQRASANFAFLFGRLDEHRLLTHAMATWRSHLRLRRLTPRSLGTLAAEARARTEEMVSTAPAQPTWKSHKAPTSPQEDLIDGINALLQPRKKAGKPRR